MANSRYRKTKSLQSKGNGLATVSLVCVGIDLFSRAVASQVSSALQSLTSVFGMGTGGPSPLKTLTTASKLLKTPYASSV